MTRQQQINLNDVVQSAKKSFRNKFYLLAILLALHYSPIYAQTKFEIIGNKNFSDTDYKSWINYYSGLKAKDISVDSIKNKILTSLSAEGFYNSVIEEIEIDSTLLRITIREGNATTIKKILVKEVLTDSIFIKSELKVLEGEFFSAAVLGNSFKRILTHYENSGFPFAIIKLDAVSFITDSTTGEHFADLLLTINEGEKSSIDKIIVEGNSKTKDYVVTRAARVNIGELYNQKIIDDIPNRLNRLRFFEHVEAPSFYLTKSNQGIFKILIKEKETNSFDGIAGYVPGKGENEAGYFTGFINISLRNLFGTGRAALIKWQQETKNSQELQLRYLEPWLFGYPFNFEIDLFQRKQDSAYVQRNIGVHLEYLASEDLSAALLVNSQSTIPTESEGGTFTVFNSTSFTTGFNFKADTRDDYYAPTKGFLFTTSYKFTQKKLNGPQSLIISLTQTKYNQQRLEFDFSYFQILFERQVLSLALHGRELKGSNLDLSDLYFLGGTNTLRGYREKQFQGNRLLWSNAEYRFLISQRTYAFAFFDYGYVLRSEDLQQRSARNSFYKSGYGFGLNIETGLGVLGVSFALGNGDSFSEGKIHFGIINEF
ncbi:MAG: outer membrane protein [Ignavibacteria bacterium]|nr:MAG: outer membrane protein [Ignavibacteria bacterium]KAF0159291.1 MAG: outer membrane protein [Ignavibacteria bacterium]